MTYISWSSDSVLNLKDYLMDECCTGDTQGARREHPCTSDTFLVIEETVQMVANLASGHQKILFKIYFLSKGCPFRTLIAMSGAFIRINMVYQGHPYQPDETK